MNNEENNKEPADVSVRNKGMLDCHNCGGKAEIIKHNEELCWVGDYQWTVSCSCGERMFFNYKTKEEAIYVWSKMAV